VPCEKRCTPPDPVVLCRPIAQFTKRYPDSPRAPHLRQVLVEVAARMDADKATQEQAEAEARERQLPEKEAQEERTRQRQAQANECYQSCMRACTKRLPMNTCGMQCVEGCVTFEDGISVGPK
jgi:hypothetical protein